MRNLMCNGARGGLALRLALAAIVGLGVAQPCPAADDEPEPVGTHSFEASTVPAAWRTIGGGSVAISDRHYKHGTRSLAWTAEPGSSLWLIDPEGLAITRRPTHGGKHWGGIKLWIYNEQPTQAELRFRVGSADDLRRNDPRFTFPFHLDFRGWRAAWIVFEDDAKNPDYQGQDDSPLEVLEVIAPSNARLGPVYFDRIEFMDYIAWHRAADEQVPFLNTRNRGGPGEYLKIWRTQPPHRQPVALTADEAEALVTIEARLRQWLLGEGVDFAQPMVRTRYRQMLKWFERGYKAYETYGIVRDGDRLTGLPLFVYKDETNGPYHRELFEQAMLPLAMAYHTPGPADEPNPYYHDDEVKRRIVDLFDHAHDQGWAAGSARGSAYGLNLTISAYANSVFLMRHALAEAGILERELATYRWVTGLTLLSQPLPDPVRGLSPDDLRTDLLLRLCYILSMPAGPEQRLLMHHWHALFDQGLAITSGWEPMVKPDGSVYHHQGPYPLGYGLSGLHMASTVGWFLRDTSFALSRSSLDNLKRGLLAARVQAYGYALPIPLNGRWPFWGSSLQGAISAYGYLAECYTPTDPELAGVFARLWQPDHPAVREHFTATGAGNSFTKTLGETDRVLRFADRGWNAEPVPSGHWAFPFSATSIHRRDGWLASVKGWSKYIWDYELGNWNRLGRYLSRGTLLIYSGQGPDTLADSGYVSDGWDWSRFPGTTVLRLSPEELMPPQGHDARSFTDQTFVGGVSHAGQHGLFALQLQDPIYEPSFHARKTWFFLGDYIVCLGSDITNDDGEHATETILFQTHLEDATTPTYLNESEITATPYTFDASSGDAVTLMDSMGNGYVVPDAADLRMVRQIQEPSGTAREGGHFTVAWIEHGQAPTDAGYQYVVLPQVEPQRLAAFAAEPSYEVWQKDTAAHIVHDRSLGITGYALFTGDGVEAEHAVVVAGSRPFMAMTHQDDGQLTLSVADPDFGWNWRIGEPHNFSTATRSVRAAPQPVERRPLTVRLRGAWELNDADADVTATRSGGQTVLTFQTVHGQTLEVGLSRASE